MHLLDLQGPPQSKGVSGLVIEHNLSLSALGALSQALEELAHLVLAFDWGAKTPDGSHDRHIRVVDVYRNQFELQIGFARQRTNRSGEHDRAGDTRASRNRGLTLDDDIPIQRSREALAHLAGLGAELLPEANGERGPSGNNKCLCRSGCIVIGCRLGISSRSCVLSGLGRSRSVRRRSGWLDSAPCVGRVR